MVYNLEEKRASAARCALATMLLFLLVLTVPGSAKAAAKNAQVDAYLDNNRARLEERLEDYNREHRLAVHPSTQWHLTLYDWEVVSQIGDRIFANVTFQVGRSNWSPVQGAALLELALTADGPEILGHQAYRESASPADSVATSAPTAAPAGASHSQEEAERYFNENLRSLQEKVGSYNKRKRIIVDANGHWNAQIVDWRIERLEGDRVFAAINYNVGRWSPESGSNLFELQWQGDELNIVGHGAMTKKAASGTRVLGYDDEAGCVYNYYAARPCLDTMRRWRDFTSFHGLEMTPETAVIFQAFKHNDLETGKRLMARARGLPTPNGDSVFDLQGEVTKLNLRRYQRRADNPCDLNPYGARPCPEILQKYRAFIARHDLPDDRRSAAMLEAYSKEDFRRADVIYALAKGLDVPAYGYIPTGLAAEVANLNLSRYQNLANPCDLTPYGARPCLQVVELWRDFADRYALSDSAENARIFAAYAEGDYKAADQLFAQAKGVSLEQLLEASGVPTKGLVIEVYPGRKQLLLRGVTGS